MSTYARRRPPKKRRDFLPIFLLLLSFIALPLLGLVGYKVMTRKPVAQTAPAADQPVQVGSLATGDSSNEESVIIDVPLGPRGSQSRSSSKRNSFDGGYGGINTSTAMDSIANIAGEALSLPKKVLIVWLFDSSKSADNLRAQVINDMPRLYQKIEKPSSEENPSLDNSPLLSYVAEYGENVNILTDKPVASSEEVKEAVSRIQEDAGHIENTFAAIESVAEKVLDYRKKKGRYITFVVVTDEVGNDTQRVDEVIAKLKPYGLPVYVIGPSAPFATVDSTDHDAEGRPPEGEVWVAHGPDSHDVDWVKIDSPRGGDMEPSVETGVGPYALARLCKETDGEYYVMGHSDGSLKGFEPQYMPEKQYAEEVQKNKAKQALINAAKLPRAPIASHMTNSFLSEDDVKRNKALEAAQKPVAKLMPAIDMLYNALKAGDADLPKLAGSNDKRWRAAFELALGRAGAVKVRHQGYIEMTAQMKSGRKFSDEKHNTWVLETTNEPMGISALDKLASKSRDYLQDVVKTYPGTPWAKAAEAELQAPLSYKWIEK
jgi:hypothetical protein